MRLHKNLCNAVIEALDQTFNQDLYADKVIQFQLKKDKRWGSRDRGFIAETTYEIVRFKRLFESLSQCDAPYSNQDLWALLGNYLLSLNIQLPDWPEFKGINKKSSKALLRKLQKERRIRESIPDWLDELGIKELGKQKWTTEIAHLNKPANVVIRANTLKTTKEKLKNDLLEEDIKVHKIDGYDDALELDERKNVFRTTLFKNGHFEVQDASSQLVARFTDVRPGMKVVDACAGAGGKTLHLASLMENKGQLIGMDIYQHKLNELKKRARRAGVHNLQFRLIDSTKPIKKLDKMADRVLLDAPCSGLGVLRRNPDSKWKLSQEFIDRIKVTQQEILTSYSRMVKPDGLLIYATCSILPSENEEQVHSFLKSEQGKDFIFVEDKKILPSQSGYDGFYMAKLKRKES